MPSSEHEAIEAMEIELTVLDPQQISRWSGDQPRVVFTTGVECGAQPGDLHAERPAGVRARFLELVDKSFAGDHAIGVEEQDCEQRALLRPAERDELTVAARLERSQDAEVKPCGHVGRNYRDLRAPLPPGAL
jgi:hypothetical protein